MNRSAIRQDPDVMMRLAEREPQEAAVARYIASTGCYPVYQDTSVRYFALGEDYWYDAVRPGIVLYGAEVTRQFPGIRPAQTLSTRPVRVAWIEAGDTVGYGRTFRAERRTRVMTLPIGYGDG